MEKKHVLRLLIFSFFVLKHIASAKDDCKPAFCGPQEPEVRFPFRIIGRQPDKCGYPGFDLSCDQQNKTTIKLPYSLSYIVLNISYLSQSMVIDPEFCRPNGIVSTNLTNTPFEDILTGYTFFNCSSQNYSFVYPNLQYPCLSSGNVSVIAALSHSIYPGYEPLNCKAMKTIFVPAGFDSHITEVLGLNQLSWYAPYCRSCERKGEACRFKIDDGETVCVSSSGGISKSAKYGLSIGIGVPALICIIGLVCYASSRVQGNNNFHNQSAELSTVPINPQTAFGTGLDGPTIESYPLTILGDSYGMPNDNGTCAICLGDYKPKESLRTIPECNHSFHVKCIDEWLKLHATCPVCRKTPKSSTSVALCSKMPSSTSVDFS